MGYPFNDLQFGQDGESVTTVVEIPKNSMLKAEWDRKNSYFVLDRVEPGIFAKPCNYGFIPQTLDEDDDELDTLIITSEPLPMGLVIKEARVIGMVDFEDDGENDHKIIVVPADDRHYGKITDYAELGEQWQRQIEHHFNHYKDLKKPGSTKVRGFESASKAWEIIRECSDRAQKNPWW